MRRRALSADRVPKYGGNGETASPPDANRNSRRNRPPVLHRVGNFLRMHGARAVAWAVAAAFVLSFLRSSIIVLSSGTAGPHDSGSILAATLVPCGVAACFALAFHSAGIQIVGLCGSRGLTPATGVAGRMRRWLDYREALATKSPGKLSSPACVSRVVVAAVARLLETSAEQPVVNAPETSKRNGEHEFDRRLRRITRLGLLCSLGVVTTVVFKVTAVVSLTDADGAMPELTATGLSLACYALDLLAACFLAGCFLLYQVLRRVMAEWLRYQWDSLICEAAAICTFILVAPGTLAAAWAVLPLRFLCFRLMFASGLVKFASGCPAWRSLTAMCYHYETQPLPGKLARPLHNGPRFSLRASTVAALVSEILIPPLVFADVLGLGPWPRRAALAALSGFMFIIPASGRYGFFHPLSLAVLLPELDDAAAAAVLPGVVTRAAFEQASLLSAALHPYASIALQLVGGLATLPLALALAAAQWRSLFGVLNRLSPTRAGDAEASVLLRWVERAHDLCSPFSIGGHLGLFARMTTERREVLIELADKPDGPWRPVRFLYKPYAADVPPPSQLALPFHMPRLDWALWFASLKPEAGTRRGLPRYVLQLVRRLMEGDIHVLSLVDASHWPFAPMPARNAKLDSAGSDLPVARFARCPFRRFRIASRESSDFWEVEAEEGRSWFMPATSYDELCAWLERA